MNDQGRKLLVVRGYELAEKLSMSWPELPRFSRRERNYFSKAKHFGRRLTSFAAYSNVPLKITREATAQNIENWR